MIEMCLSDIRDLEYSIDDPSQDEYVIHHVKLTDSALKVLEQASRNSNASFKLSLNGDNGSLVVHQPNRTIQYTLSSNHSACNDAFHDCVALKKNRVTSYGRYNSRLIVNAKDDSFEMARERMVQAENEQRNNCAKTLSGGPKANKGSVVVPRNCSSLAKGPGSTKEQLVAAESISPGQMREMVINLLALRAHGLGELHQKLKCRGDSSAKKELNTLLKEVSSCGSDGSFQLLPKFYQEVNLNWSGFTSIDKIKVEHLKRKHEPTASPLPLSHKLAILDDLKAGLLSRAQILRKHSVSALLIDQLLAQEDQLREAQRRQQKSSESMRISTAPRLPSAASTRSNHFHLPNSGSNSAPVSAEGAQPPASRRIDAPMPKEYPVVASTHSQKSSSGCSSMASSILSSPSHHQGLSAYVSADKKPKLPPAPLAQGTSDPFAPLTIRAEAAPKKEIEDPVAVATMIARSMRGAEEASDEATSCNSGFMTPEQQPTASPAPTHCDNPMAFGPAFHKRLDAQKTLLFQTYPEVRTERDSAAYKREFDTAYPRYLSLREKSNQRWFEIKRLHDQLQEALTLQLNSRHSLALQLSELSREARSHEVQEEELGLAVLEGKLRLLKDRIVDYNKSRLPHDSLKRRKHSKNSEREKKRAKRAEKHEAGRSKHAL